VRGSVKVGGSMNLGLAEATSVCGGKPNWLDC